MPLKKLRDHVAIGRKAAQTRLERGTRSGPKKGHEGTLRTRLGWLLAVIASDAKGRMVHLDFARLAKDLDCAPETLRKATRKLRDSPWLFTEARVVICLTHERSDSCPRGRWMLWVIGRHYLASIFATPGAGRQLRWNARMGKQDDWQAYARRLREWSEARIFLNKKRHGKHKGFSHGISARAGGARALEGKNRPAYRRYLRVALKLTSQFCQIPHAPTVNTTGFMVNRLAEQHSQAAISQALIHSCKLLRKRRQTRLDNPAAWLCAVAERNLNADGFTPTQRKRHWQKSQAAALKEGLQNRSRASTFVDHGKVQSTTGTGTVGAGSRESGFIERRPGESDWSFAYRVRDAKRIKDPWES